MRPVPEREAAKAVGERFYFVAKPCRNGHTSKRYAANGLCSTCATRNTLKCQKTAPEHPARRAARAAGETHYSVGKSCRYGHADRRYVSNGICVQCADARCAKWHDARPGVMAAVARKRRAKDPTAHRAEVKRWADKNPEKKKSALKRWQAANIEYVRAMSVVYSNQRRVREAENGGSFTCEDVTDLRNLQKGRCAVCKTKPTKLEVDHIVAVTKGGRNDRRNLQLLCRTCNASKGARDPIDWALQNGRLC
jgi:5-methylcytosine-specific restriction endonuclease McrA